MMHSQEPLLAAVRRVVEEVAGPDRSPSNATAETPLADGYWLDSVDLLEVLVACETTFGVAFDGTRDFGSGALVTLGSLTDLIRSKLPMSRDDT